jgi:hypothetical protein
MSVIQLSERKPEWPLMGYAPGSYFCRCHVCGDQFEGDKRAFQCLPCAVAAANDGLVKLKVLDVEVQAAKDFGGGFFADTVNETTRQFYRDEVERRKGAAIHRSLTQARDVRL